jgi:hypothetical protein
MAGECTEAGGLFEVVVRTNCGGFTNPDAAAFTLFSYTNCVGFTNPDPGRFEVFAVNLGPCVCCTPTCFACAAVIPNTVTATVSNQTGNCTGVSPTTWDMTRPTSTGDFPCVSACWSAFAQPALSTFFQQMCLCCQDGSGVWVLQEFDGVNPNCYTYRPDLSSCDLHILVFDGNGGNGPNCGCEGCDPDFCSGTFRVTITW